VDNLCITSVFILIYPQKKLPQAFIYNLFTSTHLILSTLVDNFFIKTMSSRFIVAIACRSSASYNNFFAEEQRPLSTQNNKNNKS